MNIKNRTIYCKDNLEILRGINSETFDLIYLDPPFNSGSQWQAPIGSVADGAEFKDTWYADDVKDEWVKSIEEQYPKLYAYLNNVKTFARISDYAYLVFMSIRILEMHRVLKRTGSIYFQCDATMGHYIKVMMDIIFGRKNFRREIIWQKNDTSGYKSAAQNYVLDHEIIYYYVKDKDSKVTFNKIFSPYSPMYVEKMMKHIDPVTGLRYRQRNNGVRYYENGFRVKDGERRPCGMPVGDVWTDIASFQTNTQSAELVNYPTQKPLKLLKRIIETSSNEGDLVLDPFCGCATTPVAAHKLNREWVGIDVSPKAYELVDIRINKRQDGRDLFSVDDNNEAIEINMELTAPIRTDIEELKQELQTQDEKRRRSLTKAVREAVYKRDKGRCVECGSRKNLHYDHIIPFSLGGSNTVENLQILCAEHNLAKGNRAHS